jgi:hypothetical protein
MLAISARPIARIYLSISVPSYTRSIGVNISMEREVLFAKPVQRAYTYITKLWV